LVTIEVDFLFIYFGWDLEVDFGSLHYKSISTRSCIWYMLLYFSIKVQKHALPGLPIVKLFTIMLQ